ncbi:MAG: ATP-binding cassette domain-containing protein [Anaeroplasmataceae bacterium]|nr:ATP-binding cassette domain-containing protein [Anaeroplasmataceae bacterium]
MIKIQHLNKYYNKGKDNEIHVINDVTLELPNTGLISFLGPSGSGKTTLLNVIGGLDKAKGKICYDSLVMDNYKMHKVDQFRSKEIGYVFQNYNLLLEETVYDNLVIALEMIGIFDALEQEKRIEYTLKAVGMYKYRKKRAYALSGGQQQRVSIARALIKKARIIIADEPTGNLDSENTIEVMNILKKISKTSLVLIVTHNEEVANFYSEQVIRVKDGAISTIYSNDGITSLNTEQTNTIFLKDMNLTEEQGELVSFKYYTTAEAKPLEVRIIEKNGTYFISSTKKLRLIEDTNLRIVDDHYQALKQEEIDQFHFDTSWYNETSKSQNIFKRVFHSLRESFNKMRFSKRRAKLLYAAFFTIGILLAICVIGFSNYYLIDDTGFCVDKRFDMIEIDGYNSYEEYIDATYSIMDYTEYMTSIESMRIRFEKHINYTETITYGDDMNLISYYGSEGLKLLAGKAPKKNELVISKKIADGFIKRFPEYFPNYDSLVGLENFEYSGEYRISGIVDTEYPLAYMDDETFLKYNRASIYRTVDQRDYKKEKALDTYQIVEGRDFTEADALEKYVLVYQGVGKVGEKFRNTEYEIIGTFKFKNYPTPDTLPFIYYSSTYAISSVTLEEYSYAYQNYEIAEGREASSSKECLASVYTNFEIGQVITIGQREYTIVGKYYSDSYTMGLGLLFSREACMLNRNVWFQVKDKEAVKSILKEPFKTINVYDFYYMAAKELQQENFLIFGILALALLAIISIFIYFIMRSRMISDIYPIGVYRSIGASRLKIVLRFVSDIFVTITLTALVGYVLTSIIFQTIAANVNNTLSMNALKSSYLFVFLGAVILYGLNLIFGLLPILLLMRKTPAEIISKYDI